jgi:hypothetical protein
MVEYIVELPGHDNGVTRELVVQSCVFSVVLPMRDRQYGKNNGV